MILWPDRIVRANNSKPTLRKHPNSIRQKVEGAFKICRRSANSRAVEKAIDIFLRNQVTELLDGETLLEASQAQIVQIINLLASVIED